MSEKEGVEAEERKHCEEMSECDLQFLFSQHVREGRLCDNVIMSQNQVSRKSGSVHLSVYKHQVCVKTLVCSKFDVCLCVCVF